MKNLRLSFGFDGPSKWERWTYLLCTKLVFLPYFDIQLFKTFYNSDRPFLVNRHAILIGWFMFCFELNKRNGKWILTNLTNK